MRRWNVRTLSAVLVVSPLILGSGCTMGHPHPVDDTMRAWTQRASQEELDALERRSTIREQGHQHQGPSQATPSPTLTRREEADGRVIYTLTARRPPGPSPSPAATPDVAKLTMEFCTHAGDIAASVSKLRQAGMQDAAILQTFALRHPGQDNTYAIQTLTKIMLLTYHSTPQEARDSVIVSCMGDPWEWVYADASPAFVRY